MMEVTGAGSGGGERGGHGVGTMELLGGDKVQVGVCVAAGAPGAG